ncbi:MAG: threonylcarbamoyl-AMP synthase [Bdellovibrionales bacterium]|jgi:tRNA threonylcarbamoyl adenosine modification protein (Sua5/YciO/YrdC/YwlC family)|nr:threonylcarbamoyl-AMP synthase [Bdellovibrionales bacterium]MBT3525816.1 threonylcarbamoyl-AMP synthase [Bdellovibrionales bacterium]MBT7669715.1 threonylcarbamoyl-AMP synthase [Bdellovibrionales bacterium]MBT7767383.1 threonylcarbamoyl-AMP synthase [Bdellovibrionales bacterium]
MIEYVIPNNPDDRILDRISTVLDAGKVVVLPTDTNWVFVASIKKSQGAERLYRIKGLDRHKHLTVLCNSISQASHYAVISNAQYRLIRPKLPGPFTFIFNPTSHLPRVLKSYKRDKEIGIRVPQSTLISRLIEAHQSPLVSTSLTLDLLLHNLAPEFCKELGGVEEIYSYLIEEAFSNQVEVVVDSEGTELSGNSTVVDFSNQEEGPQIIRQGSGTF